MRKNGRKEITYIFSNGFKGVTSDGGLVFDAYVYLPNLKKESNWVETEFKLMTYENGIMEIAIDSEKTISIVVSLVCGIFSKRSNLNEVDSVIFNYRNVRLQIWKNTGRKDIICVLMKAMSGPDYKNGDNEIHVNTDICQNHKPLRNSDIDDGESRWANCLYFSQLFRRNLLIFRDMYVINENICISAIKNGVVTIESPTYDFDVFEFITSLKKFFIPYSNSYGVKALEVEFDNFSIKVDEQNIDRILYLYNMKCYMSNALDEKKKQEYYNSIEYIQRHAKLLKKNYRRKLVIKKVRNFQKKNTDFNVVNEKKQKEWEDFKARNKDAKQKCIIHFSIVWAQYMEYFMFKHNKKLSDIWELSSKLAGISDRCLLEYRIHREATFILSIFWKYGKELIELYSDKASNPPLFMVTIPL